MTKHQPLREVLRQSMILLSWVPVAVAFSQTVGYVTWVQGRSMQPSMNPDSNLGWRDLIFVYKWGKKTPGAIKVGDVVVTRSPDDPSRMLVKRVLGVGGDEIIPRPGSRYPAGKKCKIPPSHVWLEGDNIHSIDSNQFGPVSLGLLVGKGTKIVFPPSRYGPIPSGGRDARADAVKFAESF